MTEAFLSIENLSARVAAIGTPILRSVSLKVIPGETHGLVGESGAGKSMIGKAIMGLLPRAIEITEGEIWLEGRNLLDMKRGERRRIIGAQTAIIPQDPLTALNPSRRIGPQMTDRLTHILGWAERKAQVRALGLLEEVHIRDPKRVMHSYPHELSGGMRQRVLIAAAFAAEPKLIVADEPTTALDVTVQKQILRLIAELKAHHETSLLFVTHDMGVVAKICQRVSVLFSGRIVEQNEAASIFSNPGHAYTKSLIQATPRYDRPDESLLPVDPAILEALDREIATHDRQQGTADG